MFDHLTIFLNLSFDFDFHPKNFRPWIAAGLNSHWKPIKLLLPLDKLSYDVPIVKYTTIYLQLYNCTIISFLPRNSYSSSCSDITQSRVQSIKLMLFYCLIKKQFDRYDNFLISVLILGADLDWDQNM